MQREIKYVRSNMDKNTGYSSITAHEKIKQNETQQGHFNV